MTPLLFLQSKEWLDFQKSLGREIFAYDKDGIKAGIIKLPLWFGKSYLYIPHGPAMDFNAMLGGEKNPVWNLLHWLKDLAKKEQSIFIKAEPDNDHVAQTLAERKFRRSPQEVQPSRTVILDLEKSEAELKAAMHHKTRYNIGVAEKHSITVKESEDLDAFWELMQKTAKRDRFYSHPRDYYQKLFAFFSDDHDIKVKLFLAYQGPPSVNQGRPLAGAAVLFFGQTGFYLHGASDYNHRQYMAPYLLHWEIIKGLKFQGLKFYDFWGINARHWPGVTRFKLGWGGRTVEYPGSFDWRLSWWWYQGYKMARRIF